MTVVELILQLFHLDTSFNIIVATPSNSAAYSLTETLVYTAGLGRKDLVRIVSNSQVEQGLVPDILQNFCATINSDENEAGNKVSLSDLYPTNK